MTRFLLYHIPAVLYAVAIIVVSSIPDLQPPRVREFGLDKLAHSLEYAILAVLAFRSISRWGRGLASNRTVLLSALFVCLFAIGDETYQNWIPGRFSDVYDVLADLLGALLVLVALEWRRRRSLKADPSCS
jgi:VanZ family protein